MSQSVVTSESHRGSARVGLLGAGQSRTIVQDQTAKKPANMRKRPASPTTTFDGVDVPEEWGRTKRRQRHLPLDQTSVSTTLGLATVGVSRSIPQVCQTSTPMTPSLENRQNLRGPKARDKALKHLNGWKPGFSSSKSRSDSREYLPTHQELNSEPEGDHDNDEHEVPFIPSEDSIDLYDSLSLLHQTESAMSSSTTPPPIDENTPSMHFPSGRVGRRSRPRPHVLETMVAQDLSLPSPSLSPVTAANLQNRRNYFETAVSGESSLGSNFEVMSHNGETDMEVLSIVTNPFDQDQMVPIEGTPRSPDGVERFNETRQSPSLMSIPAMLDTFDAMPTELKSYVMYQFLRRCPKPVLHFVSDVVEPALKCDFLTLLPLELCLNVVGYLDLKSLCNAAQVSKKWRQVINSDEKAWKNLFDKDGYKLPADELQRAIKEGWGWQHASRIDEWEQDLCINGHMVSDTDESASLVPSLLSGPSNPKSVGKLPSLPKRSKRKAPSKAKVSGRRQQKRKDGNSRTTVITDVDIQDRISSSEDGPYAAASMAIEVVPRAQIGISTLRNFHLFKSIYQRHHLIRASWMLEEPQPRHIAFKAHQRHVVTCLQFDSDKIITGSDDTKINVYDTKTGALRARLEGHDGGVWALQYEGNVLVSGSTDRSVRVWDIEKGKSTHVFQGHTSTVRCLQILMPQESGKTSDGKAIMLPKQPLIITGSRDSNLRVWRLPKTDDQNFFQAGPPQDDRECPFFVRMLEGHHHSVRAIAAHADTLVSGSYDCTVRVWKISTGETVHRLQGHAQKVYSVVLDPKRNRCISGSMDNMVKIWSLDTGSVLFSLEGHSSLVGLLDLQQDRLVSAAADSTLRVWDPEHGHCTKILRAHTGAITCFQHDGQKVISGSDQTLKMWNVKTGELVKDLLTDLSGVWQVKFNERRCVAAVQRNNLTYIEVILVMSIPLVVSC